MKRGSMARTPRSGLAQQTFALRDAQCGTILNPVSSGKRSFAPPRMDLAKTLQLIMVN